MSKKLEKLKEVNAQLTNVLIQLETRMFIDNIDSTEKKIIREKRPEVIAILK